MVPRSWAKPRFCKMLVNHCFSSWKNTLPGLSQFLLDFITILASKNSQVTCCWNLNLTGRLAGLACILLKHITLEPLRNMFKQSLKWDKFIINSTNCGLNMDLPSCSGENSSLIDGDRYVQSLIIYYIYYTYLQISTMNRSYLPNLPSGYLT